MGNVHANDHPVPPGTPVSKLLEKPIVLQSIATGRSLQNGWGRWAVCASHNTDAWEQLLILPVLQTEDQEVVAGGKVVVGDRFVLQSRWDNRNLQVLPNGGCCFENHNKLLWEQFTIETGPGGPDSDALFFVSCHTGNVLQCRPDGEVRACNTNRLAWEQFRAIWPGKIDICTEGMCFKAMYMVAGVLVVVCVVAATGALLWAAVPAAMTTFGTVVPGVGTMHAGLAAGGVAAACQAGSATLLSTKALSAAALVGVAAGNAMHCKRK